MFGKEVLNLYQRFIRFLSLFLRQKHFDSLISLSGQVSRYQVILQNEVPDEQKKNKFIFSIFLEGSSSEVDTQLLIAKNLWFLSEEKHTKF